MNALSLPLLKQGAFFGLVNLYLPDTAQSGDYATAQITESRNRFHTGARVIASGLGGFVSAGTGRQYSLQASMSVPSTSKQTPDRRGREY